MYMKKCTKCYKKSYSSNRLGKWVCPYCGANLTEVEARIPQSDNIFNIDTYLKDFFKSQKSKNKKRKC